MRRLASLLSLCVALASISFVAAQNSKPVYALIGQWEVVQSESKLFEELFTKYQKPVLDGFLADGTLVEWGFDTAAIHTAEGYTHSRWIAAESRANVEKAIMGIMAVFEKMPADQRTKINKDFDRMIKKHRDSLVETSDYQAKPGLFTKGYIVVSTFQAQPGKGSDLAKYWAKSQKPVYDQLFRDGVIMSYGVDHELFHTEEPGAMFVWYVIADMAAEDKVDQAFNAARDKLSQEERDAQRKAMDELTKREKHRDSLSLIRYYSVRGLTQPTS